MNQEIIKRLGFEIKPEGVYFNPGPKDKRLTVEEIHKELLKAGVVNPPLKRIQDVLESELEEPILITDEFEEYDRSKDEYIKVHISKDRLEAYLTITFPPIGPEITIDDIMYNLYSRGIVFGIDKEKIKRIVQNKIYLEREIIAQGIEPIYGDDAQIVYEVDTEVSSEPLILEDGSVDFRQMNLLKTVEKDQLLAVKIPARKGVDGKDVMGNVIDSTGKDRPLPKGKFTYQSEDGLSLYAEVGGRIVREKDKLNVENILAITGDIDFSTGNIEFGGDIAISGDILTGFRVQSDGDIRVKGVIEGAEVISRKGSIIVGRGVVGQDKARLLAALDVKAEFINEALIEAGRDVEVGEYIMNSIISAGNEVRAIKGRGSIIGGKVYAEKSIEAKIVGSASNIKTDIKVGGKIEKDIYEKMLFLERDEENLAKILKSTKKEIEFIEMLKKKLLNFPEKKQEDLNRLLIKLKKVEERLAQVRAQKEELSSHYKTMVPEDKKRITISTLHRGVLVSIDNNKMLTDYTYKPVSYTHLTLPTN